MIAHRLLLASGAALLVLLAPRAEAYEFPPVDEEVAARVETCIVNAIEQYSTGSACIGVIFEACEGNDGTTYSMSACFAQEHDFWQSMIVRTFEEVSEDFRASDRRSVMGEPLSESLAKAQAAWNAFAEAQCRFVYYEAGTGTMSNVNSGACQRNLAAQRAIFLRGLSVAG